MNILRVWDNYNFVEQNENVPLCEREESKYVDLNEELLKAFPFSKIGLAATVWETKKFIYEREGDKEYWGIPVKVNIQRRLRKLLLFSKLEYNNYYLYRLVMNLLLPFRALIKVCEIVKFSYFFIRIMKIFNPDIVICNQTYDENAILACIVARVMKIPIILEVRSGIDKYKALSFSRGMVEAYKRSVILSLTTKLADRIISLSPDIKLITNKEVSIVNNLCDKEFKEISPNNQFLIEDVLPIVQIGRIEYLKNQMTTIQAFKKLQETFPNVKLFIIGRYSDEEVRYQKVFNKYLSDNPDLRVLVKEIKYRNEMKQFLSIVAKKNGILILPSLCEGFPRVILEGGELGIPGIYSKLPGNSLLIRDGINSLLLNDPLSVNELYDKMNFLVKDIAKYRQLSNNIYRDTKSRINNYSSTFINVIKSLGERFK